RGPRLGRGRPDPRRAGRPGLAGARLSERARARARRAVSGARGRRGGGHGRPGGRGAPGHSTDDTVLYGRNAVEEALRAGRRRVHRVHATSGAAREPWLRNPGVPVAVVDAEEVARRAGSEGHQGVAAEVDPYPYADAAVLLRGPAPLIVAL